MDPRVEQFDVGQQHRVKGAPPMTRNRITAALLAFLASVGLLLTGVAPAQAHHGGGHVTNADDRYPVYYRYGADNRLATLQPGYSSSPLFDVNRIDDTYASITGRWYDQYGVYQAQQTFTGPVSIIHGWTFRVINIVR